MGSSAADELHALVDELAALPAYEPLHRARRARELVDTAKAALSRVRREAIYDATREAAWDNVATELDISTAAVNKAVTAHRRSLRGESPKGQSWQT